LYTWKAKKREGGRQSTRKVLIARDPADFHRNSTANMDETRLGAAAAVEILADLL
jgi:hypothetical protein